jgi:predicted RNase H-like nuclease
VFQFTGIATSLGFTVATTATEVGDTPALAEVYPHPALLKLLDADYRIPYKIGNANRYWKIATLEARKQSIVDNWRLILDELSQTIPNVDLPLPNSQEAGSRTLKYLKRYEDALDALICGWVGIQYLSGSCKSYGDATAAIWIPSFGNPFK